MSQFVDEQGDKGHGHRIAHPGNKAANPEGIKGFVPAPW